MCTQNYSNITEIIKQKAFDFGFDLVGIVSAKDFDAVPSHWIGWTIQSYTNKTTNYMEDPKSLIILGSHAWDDLFEVVVKVRQKKEHPLEWQGRLYARRLIRWLKKQGYKAILEPGGDLLSKKRMAQLAGFGNFGKNSLIINPKYGPWIRLRCILTDIELEPDEPDTSDPCKDCEECINACPVGALAPYKIDPFQCFIGMTQEDRKKDNNRILFEKHCRLLTDNTWLMCTTCQRACPYGKELRESRSQGHPNFEE